MNGVTKHLLALNATADELVNILAAASGFKIDVPDYIRKNAQRGLDLNRDGYGGDGLTDKTKREARDMADGKITISKCKRMAAWFARHKPDMSAPKNSNKKDSEYPGAGLVAWLLWGGDSDGSMRAAEWAAAQVERAERERSK